MNCKTTMTIVAAATLLFGTLSAQDAGRGKDGNCPGVGNSCGGGNGGHSSGSGNGSGNGNGGGGKGKGSVA
ncbi:MAG: hypothetical protein U1E73_10915 [Planctomycetota bacterium]